MEMRATDYCKYAEKRNKEEIISRHVIKCFFFFAPNVFNYICQPSFFFVHVDILVKIRYSLYT